MATTATPITHEVTMPLTMPESPEMFLIPDQSRTFSFVRHGATEPNITGLRCGGDLNFALTDLGRAQALATAQRIRDTNSGVGLIVCSSLLRTRQHAAIVSGVLGGVPIIIDPLLDERRMGEWNLRSVADTEKLLAQGMGPPGGETEQEFVARVTAAFERFPMLLPLNPLVVSSKAVARVLNLLLGGSGRLTLGNGEIVQFTMRPLASPMANERIPK
jgi:probable phosphoglycerate mutase